MEKPDRNLEEQVWRRIGGQPQPDRSDLRPLLLMTWEQASMLRHLTGLLQGGQRTKTKAVAEAVARSLAAQRGIMAMTGQSAGQLRPVPIPKEPARRLLEKAFHRAGKLMTEYTARSLDPEFGVVWQTLADRERSNVTVLAELAGGLDK